MKKLYSLLFLIPIASSLLFNSRLNAQNAHLIIPKPNFISYPQASVPYRMDESTVLYSDDAFTDQTEYLRKAIEQQTGIKVMKSAMNAKTILQRDKGIYLLQNNRLANEKYRLTVLAEKIRIEFANVRGLINGIQSLLQLMPLEKQKSVSISPVFIEDEPRFPYRGMHLDVVRHIFPVSYIKKYIDYLTFHKFNTFHWHLTDDQGWRMEIESYPKLNTISAYRDETLIGHFKEQPAKYDKQPYGGYYTKTEIREIIAYAAVRGITIIPEIDIPGHSRAAIAAYPELSTRPDSNWKVATTWGMYNRHNNVLAPTKASFAFLDKVFSEVADLFPSPYIHVGGDECSKIWWKQDPATQAFMKANGIKNETALQTYFIEHVAKLLKSKGKQTIGWHEINEGELDTSTIVMNWGTDKQAIEAASKGFSVINTPGKPFYFDHYQSQDPKDSLAIHGYNPLEAVYQYNPVPKSISDKGLENKIIGGQANVWTEYIDNEKKVDYMIFPRMTALSEVLWTQPKKLNYADFLNRLKTNAIPRYAFWNSSWFKDYVIWDLSKASK